jgi:hypothetical protein
MYPVIPTFYDIGRDKFRQVLQPKTGGFSFPVSELPRLNDLVWLSYAARYDANRVLNRYARYRSIHKQAHECKCIFLPFWGLCFEPSRTTYRKVSAWRMGNHQIPSFAQDVGHVTLVVRPSIVGWQQVAGQRIVSQGAESIAHGAGTLAGYKYFHGFHRFRCSSRSQSSHALTPMSSGRSTVFVRGLRNGPTLAL